MSTRARIWLDGYRPERFETGTGRIVRAVLPELASRLVCSGHRVWAVLSSVDGPTLRAVRAAGATAVVRPPSSRPRKRDRLRTLLRRNGLVRPDVSLSFHNMHLGRGGGRVVLSLLDVLPLEAGPAYADASAREDLRQRWRRSLARANAVASISRSSVDALSRLVAEPRCPVFIAPVHSSLTGTPAVQPTDLGLPPGAEGFVLVHGGTEPRKDVVTAVAGHRRLPASLRDRFPLVILGAEWRGHPWPSEIASRDDPLVVRPGHLDPERYGDVLASARVSLCPSRFEGFDIPLLDALRLGVPALASDIAPHREVAQEAATLFPVGDDAALAEELAPLLTDEARRAERIDAGRDRGAWFTLDRSVTGYESAIEAALGSTR